MEPKIIEVSTKAPRGEMREAVEQLEILIEADMTHNDIRETLYNALKAECNDEYGPYIQDVTDKYVIYEREGAVLSKVTYLIDDSNKVTFGEPVEVVQKTVYEAKESGSVKSRLETLKEGGALISRPMKLTESTVRKDGTIPLKIIEPGWGTTGYYSEEVLKRDAGIYKEGTKMYWDHPTVTDDAERPERSLSDLAGVLVSGGVYKEDGHDGPGVYATAKVFSDFQSSIEEMAEHIGVSHIAYGKADFGEAEGQSGKLVETLEIAASVDFVTTAGAGGAIVKMFESARANNKSTMKTETDGKELTTLKESNSELAAENARQKEQLILIEAGNFVSEILGKSELSDITKSRLQESLAKTPTVDDKGNLDKVEYGKVIEAAIAVEIEYIAKLTESGTIKGMGESGKSEKEESEKYVESLQEDFEAMGLDPDAAKIAAKGHK